MISGLPFHSLLSFFLLSQSLFFHFHFFSAIAKYLLSYFIYDDRLRKNSGLRVERVRMGECRFLLLLHNSTMLCSPPQVLSLCIMSLIQILFVRKANNSIQESLPLNNRARARGESMNQRMEPNFLLNLESYSHAVERCVCGSLLLMLYYVLVIVRHCCCE